MHPVGSLSCVLEAVVCKKSISEPPKSIRIHIPAKLTLGGVKPLLDARWPTSRPVGAIDLAYVRTRVFFFEDAYFFRGRGVV